MSSTVKQVGGDHYKAELQHWDICETYDVSYLEATATKYIVRWDRKGSPLLDLSKAKSYLERLLEDRNTVRRCVPVSVLDQFCLVNKLDPEKRTLLLQVLESGTYHHLTWAVDYLGQMIVRESDPTQKRGPE